MVFGPGFRLGFCKAAKQAPHDGEHWVLVCREARGGICAENPVQYEREWRGGSGGERAVDVRDNVAVLFEEVPARWRRSEIASLLFLPSLLRIFPATGFAAGERC